MLKSVTISGETYTVSLQTDEDEGGNTHEFMLLKSGKKELRLSPNTSDAELKAYDDDAQIGYDL